MSTDIVTLNFEGWNVRHAIIDGVPHFVAVDVATVLGYSEPGRAVRQHCKGGAIHTPLQTAGGIQQARVLSEADVMRLIVSSKLPAAQQFERWLFEEVLPEIRRTGSYGAQPALTDDQIIHQALTILTAKTAQLEAKVEADAPKVLFADSVATSDTTILVGELAKILKGNGVDVGANRLFDRLRDEGFLIKRRGTDWNMPTQRSMDLGLFLIKESVLNNPDGTVRVNKTPKVTGKGQQYFVNRYAGEVA